MLSDARMRYDDRNDARSPKLAPRMGNLTTAGIELERHTDLHTCSIQRPPEPAIAMLTMSSSHVRILTEIAHV